MKKLFIHFVSICILLITLLLTGCANLQSDASYYNITTSKPYSGSDGALINDALFSFEVAADMRYTAGEKYQSSEYFLGTCQAIDKIGKSAFMITPGDMDPPQDVYDTIKKVLGDEYLWYPVIGNHEAETTDDMVWLREWGQKGIPNLTRTGPESCKETTYSVDYKNAHFIMLNQYCDSQSDIGTDGDISDTLYEWLKNDLAANKKSMIFVIGHEPIVPMPDAHSGRIRHLGDSLDAYPKNRRRFHRLLCKYNVQAYICGHTHNYSTAKINGLWQIDAGHCRGVEDKGARSTFLKVIVGSETCYVKVYRDDADGGAYSLTDIIELK